jgi:hypothetical protein
MKKIVQEFADALEATGYERALELVLDDIVPIAKQKGLTLINAAFEYADGDEELDTSWGQLYYAMQDNFPKDLFKKFDVHI